MAEPGPSFNPVQLTVWLPEEKPEEKGQPGTVPSGTPPVKMRPPALCVELSSQDGRYIASVTYDIRGEPRGPLVLNLPRSSYAPQLDDLQPAQLAILARVAKSCGPAPVEAGDFVVAAWNQQQLGSKVVVLLNSRLPTSIGAGENKIEKRYPCNPLPGITTAFNLRCEIPVGEMAPGRTFVVEMRRGSSVNTVPLPLASPR